MDLLGRVRVTILIALVFVTLSLVASSAAQTAYPSLPSEMPANFVPVTNRSEERRVGKEC